MERKKKGLLEGESEKKGKGKAWEKGSRGWDGGCGKQGVYWEEMRFGCLQDELSYGCGEGGDKGLLKGSCWIRREVLM